MSSTDFAKQARAHYDRGAFQEAATVCRRGLLANPGDTDTRLLLGRALMAQQRYGEVLAEMRVLLEREPGHAQGLALRGEALLYKGDVAKAVQALRDAHAAAPNDAGIRALRERAEGAAAPNAAGLAFLQEDPSATMTRHYPSRPGAGPMPPRRGQDTADILDQVLSEHGPGATPAPPPRRDAGAPPRAGVPAVAPAVAPAGPAPSSGGAPRKPPAAPAPRVPAPPTLPSSAGPSASRQPDHGGSFDEPTAIYGDGNFGSKPMAFPAQPRAASLARGPALGAPDHAPGNPGAPAGAMPSVQDDAVDPSEFEDDMAPTSMIGAEHALRVRLETGVVPGGPRYSTQAPTAEAAPPPLRGAFPPTASAPALGPRGAPPPAPGMPGARLQPGMPVARVAAPTSPEMPTARAVAAAAEAEAMRFQPQQPFAPASPSGPAPRPAPPAPPQQPLAPTASVPRPASPERPALPLVPEPRTAPPERALPPFPAASAVAPALAQNQEPTIAVPRQSRPRSRVLQYVLVALVVIAAGAAGGLQLRKLRLDWEIDGARRRADELMASDTYAGYVRARNLYRDILAVRALPGDQASLARAQAALAAEFDEGYGEAQTAVQALADGDGVGPDAALARAYLALAERDAAGALTQIDRLSAQASAKESDHPFAPYLTGRARLLTGDAEDALTAFQQAAERTPRPLFLVWLGHAHRALGQEKEAADAFARALALVPDHPAALLGRAELAAAGQDAAASKELEAALDALITDGARPPGQQDTGVSSGQMARAALALVGLRTRSGDQAGARRALQQLQAMRREGDPDFAVILAQAHAELGDTEAALAELAAVVEAWPARLDARLAWAELALRAGNLDAARKALSGGEDMDEVIARNARALALRGRTRLALGLSNQALADLDAALELQPDLPDAVVARAEIDLVGGDAARAVERLAPLAGESAPAEVRVIYAAALRASGKYDQARDTLKALLDAPKAPPRTYLELARLERDQGRWSEARQAYAAAIERLKNTDPGIEARIEAARLAFDTADRPRAREAIAAAASAAASKNDGRVLVEAARIHTLEGAHQQAGAYLERAEALSSPPAAQLARERGRLALRKGELEAAIRALDKARTLAGSDPETMLLLVEAHLVQRKLDAARKVRDAAAKQPGMDPAALAMAEGLIAAAASQATGTQAARDQVTAALAAYDKARELLTGRNAAPRHLAYLDYLTGRTLFEYDRLREARKALERAIRIDPDHADPYFVLGQVEYGDEEYSDAAEAFEAALERDAASLPDAWFYLGEVEVERDHKDEAQKAFRAYLELRPEGARAADAKRYLAELDR